MQSQRQIIFAIVSIDLLGFGMVIPQLGPYARELGASGREIGFLFAIYSAMQFLFAPIWGRWSDKVGRRPILLVSLTGSVIGYLLLSHAHSLPMLFFARLVAGIMAANIPVARAYLADITPTRELTGAMGLVGAAFGIGFTFGPPLGGLLGHLGGIKGVGLGAAAMSAIALMGAWRYLPETNLTLPNALQPRQMLTRAFWQNLPLMVVIGLLFVATFAIANAQSFLPVFLKERWEWTAGQAALRVGWVLGFSSLITAAMQVWLIGGWAKRFGERRLVLFGMALLALGLAATPFVPEWHWLFPIFSIAAIGGGLIHPSLASLAFQLSPREVRGEAIGIYHSANSLARIAGPLWGGFWFDFDRALPFWTAAAMMGIVCLLSGRLLLTLAPVSNNPTGQPT